MDILSDEIHDIDEMADTFEKMQDYFNQTLSLVKLIVGIDTDCAPDNRPLREELGSLKEQLRHIQSRFSKRPQALGIGVLVNELLELIAHARKLLVKQQAPAASSAV